MVTNIECPQPAAETIAPARPLPQVPELSVSADVTVGILSNIIEQDRLIYDNEVGKRVTLANHGVEQCGWTK